MSKHCGQRYRRSHVKSIRLIGGDEVNVYKDSDGYHAEYWSEKDQYIARQSGDHRTMRSAMDCIEPWSDIQAETVVVEPDESGRFAHMTD